ncbi:biopolymer transporter ExbD [Brevundimonas sp.]|uniref:biopolymer transporter ExbD n=1 Tax=Brevundimonas sp. TaxID=1871086 RepID=UPI002FC91F0E
MGSRLSGAGGHTGAAHQNADINVTPFVDIMLVLLIIFMVAAPLATVSLKLDLPPPVADVAPADPVYITVRDNGAVFIADRETSLATLAADTCAALGGGDCRSERVFVRAEPDTRYDQFMGVMNGLYGSGFTQVGLLNEDID